MAQKPREPHSIIYRYVTRAGRNGLPESHRDVVIVQERHEWKFVQDGWTVFVRDSEVMTAPDVAVEDDEA
jgi:hypothetical protein